jgi:thiamine kinase-like enzyme
VNKIIKEILNKTQVKIVKELNSSDKSFVAIGEKSEIKVIVKILMSQEKIWKDKFIYETSIHNLFKEEKNTIPFNFIDVLYSSNNCFIAEYIDGKEISSDRYPNSFLSESTIKNILNLQDLISSWRCKNTDFLKVWNYQEKLEKYYIKGFLSKEEHSILSDLLLKENELEFNHGDLLLSNIMIDSNNRYIPIDWEFAGLFIPGFDLALLDTLLIKNDYARKSIEKIVYSKNMKIPFLINKVFVVMREIKIHRELPDNLSFKNERLSFLEDEWENIRQNLKYGGYNYQ